MFCEVFSLCYVSIHARLASLALAGVARHRSLRSPKGVVVIMWWQIIYINGVVVIFARPPPDVHFPDPQNVHVHYLSTPPLYIISRGDPSSPVSAEGFPSPGKSCSRALTFANVKPRTMNRIMFGLCLGAHPGMPPAVHWLHWLH